VIKNEVTGLLVEPEDADGLAVAILRLLRDPTFAATLGAAGEANLRGAWGTAAARVSDALTEVEGTNGCRRRR
jgi:glycosyltransferase involved in cell wall biosynthesis